jgi:hypothetical protein
MVKRAVGLQADLFFHAMFVQPNMMRHVVP